MTSTASSTPEQTQGQTSTPNPRDVAERVQERIAGMSDAELSNLAEHPDTSPSLVARVKGEQQHRTATKTATRTKRPSRATKSADRNATKTAPVKTARKTGPKLVAAPKVTSKTATKDPGPTSNEAKGIIYSALIKAAADMLDNWTQDPRAIKRGKPGHADITRDQARTFIAQRLGYGPTSGVVWDVRLSATRSDAGRRPTPEPEPVKTKTSKSTARTAQTARKTA